MNNITHIQHQFGDHLFNFIRSKVASEGDAQDVYQEVIYKIMNKSGQLQKTQSLKSWLFTIAKNQIMDYYRARKNPTDSAVLAMNALSRQQEMSVYQELEGCLSGFIDQLPETYKELITLSEIEGKSQKELSETLGINYVTLRSKVQRGRDKIKKMIFDACEIELDAAGRFVDCTPKPNAPVCYPGSDCSDA